MEKKENLEIKKAPESLTAQDLEKVSGGAVVVCNFCDKDDTQEK